MPLDSNQLAEIKENISRAEKGLQEAKADITVAERAGIDMTAAKKEVADVSQQIRRMRTVFY